MAGSTDGEQRRLLALQKKCNEMNTSLLKEKEQAAMISQSLRGSQTNRIVFSDSDDDDEKEPAKFLSDGEEEDEDVEKLFRMKGEYEGAQGQELFSQQRQIDNVTGGDKRFQMDDSFLENPEEEEEETKEESHQSREKDRMMGLLSGMLNLRPKKEVSTRKKGENASNTLDERYSFFSKHAWILQNVPRYDPTISKDKELEMSPSIDESQSKKKKKNNTLKKNDRLLTSQPAQKPLSSTKRFIKTSDSWKGLFSTKPVKQFGFLSASSKNSNVLENKSFRFGFTDASSNSIDGDEKKNVSTVVVEEEEEEEEEESSSSSDEDEQISQIEQRKESAKKVQGTISFWKGGDSSVNGGIDVNESMRLERRKRLTKDFKRKSKIAKRLRR